VVVENLGQFRAMLRRVFKIGRAERNRKRIGADDRLDTLMTTATGRNAYWSELNEQCRKSSLVALLEHVLPLDGDIVECGVFRGRSLKMIARSTRDRAPQKIILACDSFRGFPEGGISEKDATFLRPISRRRHKFAMAVDVPDRLERFFSAFGINGRIVAGYFSETLPRLDDRPLCFVHIDSDTYESHRVCLNILYDRIVPGGILVLDDYNEPRWPGAKLAVDEFFASRIEKPALDTEREDSAWFVRKP
jgi:hypothetical protein